MCTWFEQRIVLYSPSRFLRSCNFPQLRVAIFLYYPDFFFWEFLQSLLHIQQSQKTLHDPGGTDYTGKKKGRVRRRSERLWRMVQNVTKVTVQAAADSGIDWGLIWRQDGSSAPYQDQNHGKGQIFFKKNIYILAYIFILYNIYIYF